MASPVITPQIEDRFWSRVTKSDGCWEWQMRSSRTGYGSLQIGRRPWPAHRVSWVIANGPIEGDVLVLHRCHNKRCVRPDHLHLGTPADNGVDEVARHGDIRSGWISIGEASKRLSLTRATLRQQIANGQLSGRKYFEWFVSEREIERYRAASLGKPGRRSK